MNPSLAERNFHQRSGKLAAEGIKPLLIPVEGGHVLAESRADRPDHLASALPTLFCPQPCLANANCTRNICTDMD